MQGILFCLRVEIVLRNFGIVDVQGDVCQTGSFVDFLLKRYIAIFVVDGVAYYEENTLGVTVNCFLVYVRSF